MLLGKSKNLKQEYIKLNQFNWKTCNDLERLQTNYEWMMQNYNKIEQQNTITCLEQNCQEFKERHASIRIKFEKEKQTLITQI
jgi:hypothetical protein